MKKLSKTFNNGGSTISTKAVGNLTKEELEKYLDVNKNILSKHTKQIIDYLINNGTDKLANNTTSNNPLLDFYINNGSSNSTLYNNLKALDEIGRLKEVPVFMTRDEFNKVINGDVALDTIVLDLSSEQIRNKIAKSYTPLVHKLAKQWYGKMNYDYDELISIGYKGLVYAMNTYGKKGNKSKADEESVKKYSFIQYAAYCIRNSISIVRAYRSDANYRETIEHLDGLICIGKFSVKETRELIALCENIIFIDMSVDNREVSTLTIDFKTAARDALGYLKNLGHSKIAYIGGLEYASGTEAIEDSRKKEYIAFMKKNKFSTEGLVKEGHFNTASGYEMMNSILDEMQEDAAKGVAAGKPCTAVFAASDAIAYGVLRAIREHGLRVPEDISVIGINDSEMSRFSEPALTTMHAPAYEMGQHAANLVNAMSKLSIKTPLKAQLYCTLVERESCAKATGN